MDKENILSKRLSFLNEKELKKVIDKYSNSKLSVDVIVKEVCKDYNVNYDYIDKSIFDKSITNISGIISEYIKQIIKIVRKSIYSRNLESSLEAIVKIIVFILSILFIKLPFIIVENIFNFINSTLFYPFNDTFDMASNFILSIIYLLICITLLVKFFGNYRISEKKEVPKEKIDSVEKEYKWLDFVIRIVIYVVILIPLFILCLISFVCFIASVILLFKGINILGLVILFMGLVLLISTIINLLKNSLYGKNKSNIFQICVSSIIVFTGLFISIYNLNSFKTVKTLEGSVIKEKIEDITLKLDSLNTKIYISKGDYEFIVDDSIEVDNIKVEATYYDDYVDVVYNQQKEGDNYYLIFKTNKDKKINNRLVISNIYKDLKNGYLFNYSNVNNIKLKIYGNESTIEALKDSNK